MKITFPDKNIKEYKEGTTGLEIAKSISPSFAKKVIYAVVSGETTDLHTAIKTDSTINFITDINDVEAVKMLNHTAAHVFALSLLTLYPEAKIAIGPAIEGGFHYDFDLGDTPFSTDDFPKLEKQMQKIISGGQPIVREEINEKQARELFKDNEYKIKLIDKIKEISPDFSTYTLGNFVDLCKGPHVTKISLIKAFKLISLGGAYFQNDKNNKMIHRVYGTAWFNKEQLDAELLRRQERKERDHRTIGKQLKLFTFNDKVGKGLPLWLPNGYFVRAQIREFIVEIEKKYDYLHVSTPVLGSKTLYEISGHWDHYQDDMFPLMEVEGETFVLRPMACPHHAMIYDAEPKSYRDLPYRIAEEVLQHRFESSGSLLGMERVRAMNLTDSHVFIRNDQIGSEIARTYELIVETLERFNIDVDYIELALHEPANKEKYHNDKELWSMAEGTLEEVCQSLDIRYVKKRGEAAFYGPKIDVQVKTALGHIITMATIQLDFLLGKNFKLTYKDKDGSLKTPVTIHRGLIGTYERFLAVLIEQTKGVLPLWLVPKQAAILPVKLDLHGEYAEKVMKEMNDAGL